MRRSRRRVQNEADLSVDRLLDVPLVSRHGARVVRGRVDRGRAQSRLRPDQGRSRGAAGRRSRLHDVRAGDDRRRRLADERVAHAGPQAVLRRHLLSAGVAVGPAGLRRRADRARRARGATSAAGSSSRPRRILERLRAATGADGAAADRAPVAGLDAIDSRHRGVRAGVRRPPRRLRRRAEVSAAVGAAVPAERARADRRRRARSGWRSTRCARWRSAGCATTSAAASIATRSTPSGACRTSRRCSTTRRSSCSRTSRPAQVSGEAVLRRRRRGHARLRPARSDRARWRVLLGRRRRLGVGSAEGPGPGRRHGASFGPEAVGPGTALGHVEKREGAFYVWTRGRNRSLFGDDAPIVRRRFGIEDAGNAPSDPQGEFRGQNILYVAQSIEDVAARTGRTDGRRHARRWSTRAETLFDARGARPRPHLDDKVITAWNGLMIAALARAARVARRQSAARRVAARRRARGRRVRDAPVAAGRAPAAAPAFATAKRRSTASARTTPASPGASLELFQATGEARWLDWAVELTDVADRAVLRSARRRLVQHDRRRSVRAAAAEGGLRRRRAGGRVGHRAQSDRARPSRSATARSWIARRRRSSATARRLARSCA